MPLHLITTQQPQQLKDCLSNCNCGDAIVLMSEAAALAASAIITTSKLSNIEIYQLEKEEELTPTRDRHRGISRKIDMAELVNLTTQHNPIVSW
ncbi:MAG: hypothetical protein CL693_09770 [Cellvibrionaceae bacterium]|nr:hypothetical protein [Cellvibrionaceae bacterium]|tara:strand:+ start:9086 stop:9367 length:282 start_codon:yes stop_codon:yes gene_type:complete